MELKFTLNLVVPVLSLPIPPAGLLLWDLGFVMKLIVAIRKNDGLYFLLQLCIELICEHSTHKFQIVRC